MILKVYTNYVGAVTQSVSTSIFSVVLCSFSIFFCSYKLAGVDISINYAQIQIIYYDIMYLSNIYFTIFFIRYNKTIFHEKNEFNR